MRFIAFFSVALTCLSVASGADFNLNGRTLSVPDGYTVELVASAPTVERPISASFDEQGHLYVTDSAGMAMPVKEQLKVLPHRILRLDDTQGNGHFDKSVVFADKMMFPEGCLWFSDSLYVCAPPQIWKFTDTKNTGVADKREIWFDGKTLTGCANDLHGPYLGPDGRIYWCKGADAKQSYVINGNKFETRASHIFRAKPDGTNLEPMLTGGMDNPVGVAFSPEGERFLSCTFFQDPGGGKRDGLIHAIYGGVYGKIRDVINDHPRTGEVMPVLAHFGAAAPCGITYVEAGVLGPRPALLTCCFNLHRVMISTLTEDGATFTTEQSALLASDHTDFHPTDVLQDADGSFLVVDTGGWYKICCPTSQLAKPDVLGAIYRVRRANAPKLDDPRGLKLAWEKQDASMLAPRLGDARPAVRKRATESLAAMGMAAVPVLENLLSASSVQQRIAAVWTLSRIEDTSARAAEIKTLNDSDNSVVHAALQAIALHRDAGENELRDKAIVKILLGPDLALRRAAAETLGRVGGTQSPGIIFQALEITLANGAHHADAQRILEHSLTYALIELGQVSEVRKGLTSNNPTVRRVALIALDQMKDGDLKAEDVIHALRSEDEAERKSAKWVAIQHRDWGDALAKHFSALLEQKTPPSDLDRNLAAFAKAPAIQAALQAVISRNDLPESRRVALRAMALSGLRETPSGWLDALSEVINGANDEDLTQMIRTIRALRQPKEGHAPLRKALLNLMHSNPSDALRLEALAAIGNIEPDSDSFALLLRNCVPTQPISLRLTALQILAHTNLNVGQKRALAETLATCGAMEVQQLLPVFEKESSPEVGHALVVALQHSPGRQALRAATLRETLSHFPQTIQNEANELLHTLDAAVETQAAHLEEVLNKLPPGDAKRGHVMFTSQKAGCTNCHAIGYLGGNLGPDLTGIGKVRTKRDLLESIMYPSASFVRSYEPYAVLTNTGQRFNGILRKDNADEIVLATGPQTEEHITRANITKMQPGTVSLMPEGFGSLLSFQELADVLAFLKNE